MSASGIQRTIPPRPRLSAILVTADIAKFIQIRGRERPVGKNYVTFLRSRHSGVVHLFDLSQRQSRRSQLERGMATVQELWQMAHDLYARARTSIDPSTKQMLMRRADDLLKEAEELRTSSVVQAVFPKPERKFG
jgi:hypothetical protein